MKRFSSIVCSCCLLFAAACGSDTKTNIGSGAVVASGGSDAGPGTGSGGDAFGAGGAGSGGDATSSGGAASGGAPASTGGSGAGLTGSSDAGESDAGPAAADG